MFNFRVFCLFVAFVTLTHISLSSFINEPCSERNTMYITEEFSDIKHKTQCLDITGINIKLTTKRNFLEIYDIGKVRKIETIFAENIGLTALPKIEKFASLEEFHLPNNKIKYIPPKAFKRNHKLRLLILNKNYIRTKRNQPIIISSSLETLILSINNIVYLNKNSFKGLPKLKTLYLDNNKITDLPYDTFELVTNLKYLRITKNPIKSLSIYLPPQIELKSDIENVDPELR